MLKWMVQVLMLYDIIVITSPSITGVTYMDNFDFKERYTDVNECNPFYWHPLHLPPYCVEIFEKLIRSRLASNTPIRITREREKGRKHRHGSNSYISENQYHHPDYNYPEQLYQFPYPLYQITSAEYESFSPPYTKSLPLSPYEQLMKLLKEDVKKEPSSPTVTVMPSLGPVALYKQGISQKSVDLIRELAEAYVKATKEKYDEYYSAFDNYPSEPHIYVYDSAKNNTKEEKPKKENKKDKKKQDEKKKEEKEKTNKVYKMKTKHGGVVTIIETTNLDMMKKDQLLI